MSDIVSYLTPLHEGESRFSPSGQKYKTLVCRCELCGNITTILASNLSKTKSCGCAKIDFIRKASITHGESKTRLYRIWSLMKDRTGAPTRTQNIMICTVEEALPYAQNGLNMNHLKSGLLQTDTKKHCILIELTTTKGMSRAIVDGQPRLSKPTISATIS